VADRLLEGEQPEVTIAPPADTDAFATKAEAPGALCNVL
jgi:hypothetical protein